jgi:hypothetical protein
MLLENNKNLSDLPLKFGSPKKINDDLISKTRQLKITEWDNDDNKNSQWSTNDYFKLKEYLPGNILPHNFIYKSPSEKTKKLKKKEKVNQIKYKKSLDLKNSDFDFDFLKVETKICTEKFKNPEKIHFNLQKSSNSLSFINRHFESFDVNLNQAKTKIDQILNPTLPRLSQENSGSLSNVIDHEENDNIFETHQNPEMYQHLDNNELISEIMRQMQVSNSPTNQNTASNSSSLRNSQTNNIQDLFNQSFQRDVRSQSNEKISQNNLIQEEENQNLSNHSEQSIKDCGSFLIKNIVKSKYK